MAKHRFVQVHNELIDGGLLAEMGPYAAAVLLVLLRHVDADGRCYPSRKRIAKLAGVGLRTVDKQIQKLFELRLLTKSKIPNDGGFDRNCYQVNSAKDAKPSARRALASAGNALVVAPQMRSPSAPDAHEVDPKNKNHKGKSAFVYPTVDEVRVHCEEMHYAFDPEAFVAYYESNGWMVGRSKMKSWKAACSTWHIRNAKKKVNDAPSPRKLSTERVHT